MIVALPPDPMASARARIADCRRLQEAGLINLAGEFYPSVHYPPITMYTAMTEEQLLAGYRLPEDGLFDVYAHIPFCHRRCVFCHYPVKLGPQEEEKDRYLDAMEKEIDIYRRLLGLDRVRVRSILVGGGTPSHLTPRQLARFLEYFLARLDVSRCRQFNYDVDPATLVGPEGLERLRIMRSHGVDRLTLGVQSLDDEILKLMNRPHDARVALEAIENCKALGYQVNIEFIFGHPGETLQNWMDVMERAVTLGVDEIQLYRLKVEAYGDYQGPIKQLREIRPESFPSNDETLMMKQLAIDILAAHGYRETLRRVFARDPKHYSRYAHNQCCMLYDQLGLGLTAFSSLRDRFGLNTPRFDEYYAAIDAGRLPLNRGLIRSPEQQMRWAIILSLKNRDVRKDLFQKRTGVALETVFRGKIEKLKNGGLLAEDQRTLSLTPLGEFFADEVAEQFCHPDYLPFPRSAYADGPLNPYQDCEP
jgi:oxygen-independent coproporphyrinogen-3 oxidase